MTVFNYIRVSSKDQNLARQEEAFKTWASNNNITDYLIFQDKLSGKDFERVGYQELISVLKEGDLLVVKSIDRLGRNYDLIIEEWTRITKQIKADIVVLDMPLLDTREKNNNLTGKFISDIVLQLLSYVAEIERTNIKQRQAEGIKIALENGVHFGPEAKINGDEAELFKKEYLAGVPYAELMMRYDISKPTLIKLARNLGLPPRNKKRA